MFNLTIDNPEILDRFASGAERAHLETTNWLVDMAMWIKEDLKQRVPVKTGKLKSSLRYEFSQNAAGGEALFYGIYYGAYLDEGTKPFTMTATRGKPMAFMRGSDKVFAMTVKNPGIKAQNFTSASIDAAVPQADKQADTIAQSIWKAVIG